MISLPVPKVADESLNRNIIVPNEIINFSVILVDTISRC